MTSERETIDAFLSGKRVLFVGVSQDPADFSRAVRKELLDHGYEIVAVNPHGGTVDDTPVLTSVEAAEGTFDFALVMTPPSASEGVVRACAAKGLRRVWLHRGAGEGSVSDAAVAAGNELGLEMVVGRCPLMFLEPGLAVHRVHAGLSDLAGNYPHRAGERGPSLRRAWPVLVVLGLAAAIVVYLGLPRVLPGTSATVAGVVAVVAGLLAMVGGFALGMPRATRRGR